MPQMEDSRLKAICEAKLTQTLGWIGGKLSKERQKALSYYRGDLFGNEQDGRSKVVSRDVAESVDSAMPSLLKVFATTDLMVSFNARQPEYEEAAKQATDYINWIVQSQEDWFDFLQTTIKDGLVSKTGTCMSWWDESEEVKTEEYEGLTTQQYQMLMANPDVEVTEAAESPAEVDPTVPPQPGDDGKQWACKLKRTNKIGKVKLAAVPNEEFLTEMRAISYPTLTYAARRFKRTRSELIEEGYDKETVMSLPGAGDLDFNSETANRFRSEDDWATKDSGELDETMREVWVAEQFLKVDYNGDGVAEWRKVTMAGAGGLELLDNEECDGHIFTGWTPYKQPHKLIGESMADKTMDIQLWKSTVVRQANDGIYFNNMPQLGVVEGGVNMEDVLTRRPGGVIRMKAQGNVFPIPTSDTSASSMQMVSYIDSVRETRTGVRRFTAGLNGDELNPYASTATGANLVDDASQDALMLIARNYAEGLLKPLFKRLLELVCKHQDKPLTVKLHGQWVNVDPSTWTTDVDMTISVGLGTGNRTAQQGFLMQLLSGVDAQIVQLQGGLNGPLLTEENVYNKIIKLVESGGFKDTDNFYTDPANAPPKPPEPPKPDPEMVKVQGQLAIQKQKNEADIQAKVAQGQLDARLEQQKAERQAHTEAAQAQADMATDRMHAQNQAQLDQMKAQHQLAIETMKAQHELEIQRQRAAADIEIARAKAAVDAHAKLTASKAKPDGS